MKNKMYQDKIIEELNNIFKEKDVVKLEDLYGLEFLNYDIDIALTQLKNEGKIYQPDLLTVQTVSSAPDSLPSPSRGASC